MKEALGGIYIFPYRTITLPNVLKIRILAARKLADLPNLKPRVEVTLRTTKLSTPSAERVESSTGAVEYRFDSDMIIPAEYAERDGVLVVRVYNDNVGLMGRPRLIGQWFMTLKYLVMFPTYCKHSKIVAPGDGSIAGTFLLTDAKLQGSAMRDREAWDLVFEADHALADTGGEWWGVQEAPNGPKAAFAKAWRHFLDTS